MTRRSEGSLSPDYSHSRRDDDKRNILVLREDERRTREGDHKTRKREDSAKRRHSSEESYRKKRRRRRSSRHRSKERSSSGRYTSKRRHKDRSTRTPDRKETVQNTDEGHLIFKKYDILGNRYQISRELGEGTFGKVVSCRDKEKSDKRMAVKIIRNIQKYRDAAKIEIEILQKIRNNGGCEGSVEMHDSFDYHGHVCIVFEVLGKSVFDFLRDNGFASFNMAHVQRIGDDILSALMFLHDLKYTHTDLKPENVLFIDSDYESVYDRRLGMTVRHVINPAVKIIDFGSATHEKEHHSRIVSTRHYRAPEVIAEIGWSYPCDMWSVGCILFELYTGHTLFQTHDNREHLGMMEHMLGTLPASLCSKSDKRYFKKDRLDFNKSGSSGRYIRKYCKKLDHYQKEETTAHREFLALLRGLLEYDPKVRLTAADALKHPFFDQSLSDRDGRSHKSR